MRCVKQQMPVPKCICFYSNTSRKQNENVIRLSEEDSYAGSMGISIKMLNVCKEQIKELLNACRALCKYSALVDKIKVAGIEAALDSISNGTVIKPVLLEKKAEIMRMCD